MMEFHGLPRRTLQSLCKKNGIPANLTNVAMADALRSLETVEGVVETEEEDQTPLKSPPPLRPPNPPRSCRRRSVISLIKEPNFSKKRRTFIVKDEGGGAGDKVLQPLCSLSPFPVASKRQSAERTLFPCEQKEILKSKGGEEEEMSGERDEHHVFDEMSVKRKSRYKDVGEIMKVCEGYCPLNEVVVVVSSPAESFGQGNGHNEEGLKNEVFVYEEMPARGKASEDKNGTSRDFPGESILVATSPGPAEEQASRNAVFASEEVLGKGVEIEDQDDAEMVDDEKREEANGDHFCVQSKPRLASQDHLKEAVPIPSSSEGVKEHTLKNVNFSSEEKLVRGGGRDCDINEAGTMQGSTEVQGFKNRDFASEEGTGVENAELVEDEKEGEDANGYGEEGLKNGVFMYEEMPMRVKTSGDNNGTTRDCLGERPAEEQGSRNAVFASEEMLGRGDGTEDQDDAEMVVDEEGEETNGKNNLTQASRNCQFNEAFRMPNSQESDSVVKRHELELLCGTSLGGSGSDEQEQDLMDGLPQVLKGEVEGLGLKNASFASEGVDARGGRSGCEEGEKATISRGTSGLENHVCKNRLPPLGTVTVTDEICVAAAGERCEDKNDKVMKYGEGEEINAEPFCGQSNLTWACGDCKLNEAVFTPSSQESVEDLGLENAVFAYEEVTDEDAQMMEYKTEEEERTSSRKIHISTGNLEANGESFCQRGKPGSGDSPSKAIAALRDQEHGVSPNPSLGPLIPFTNSSSPRVLQIGLQLCSSNLEPPDTPSTYGAKTGGQNLLSPETGGTIRNPIVFLNSVSKGNELAKDNTEEKQSEKKAGLDGLSLRKLRSLYKEEKKASKLGMEKKMKAENGGGETTMKDEVEEESAEKTRLNNLSLRKLKQMYKHKVSN